MSKHPSSVRPSSTFSSDSSSEVVRLIHFILSHIASIRGGRANNFDYPLTNMSFASVVIKGDNLRHSIDLVNIWNTAIFVRKGK